MIFLLHIGTLEKGVRRTILLVI